MEEFRYQIDLLQAMNQKLDRECNMYRTLIESVRSAFLFCSFEDKSCRMLGDWGHFFRTSVRGLQDVNRLLHEMDDDSAMEFQNLFYLEEQEREDAFLVIKKRNADFWIDCRISVYYDANNTPVSKYVIFRDVTEDQERNRELEHTAYFDEITGLYNRRFFLQEMDRWMDEAKEAGAVVSLSLIEIQEFRELVASYGIREGKEILQKFAQLLKSIVPEHDVTLAYLGKNMFGLSIYDPREEKSMDAIYRQLKTRLQEPILMEAGGVELSIGASVLDYPEAGTTAAELIWNAEMIMGRERQKKKDGLWYFDSRVIMEIHRRIEFETELERALLEDRFELRFHPQFETITRRLRGVLVKLYYRKEDGSLMGAGEFLPEIRQKNLRIQISKWTLKKAFATLADWKTKYRSDVIFGIKIPDVHFAEDGFAFFILDLMKEYEIEQGCIELEIEGAPLLEEYDTAVRKIALLRKSGVRMAIGNFGTGILPISQMKDLPIHAVSIAPALVQEIKDEHEENIIVSALLEMIRGLGYVSVASGVDTEEQYNYLMGKGCDFIRGRFVSEELPLEKAELLIQ